MVIDIRDLENSELDEDLTSYDENDPFIDANVQWISVDTETDDGLGTLLEYTQNAAFRGDFAALARIRKEIDGMLHDNYEDIDDDDDVNDAPRLPTENEQALMEQLQEYLDELIPYKVTTLLYDAFHQSTSNTVLDEISAWESFSCTYQRTLLVAANPEFADYTERDFRKYIEKRETQDRDYYGESISDDSDLEDAELDDDERGERDGQRKKTWRKYEHDPTGEAVRLRLMPREFRQPFRAPKKRARKKGKPAPVATVDDLAIEGATLREISAWSNKSTENAAIHYPTGDQDPWTEQAVADLQTVNEALAKGDVAVDTRTTTRFCVAQYRGITYNVNVFSAIARRQNRETLEYRVPVFSSYVFQEAGINPGRYYAGNCEEADDAKLVTAAEELKALLVSKRDVGPITVKGTKYETHAYALQTAYTVNYHGFFNAVKAYLLHQVQQSRERLLTELERQFLEVYVPPDDSDDDMEPQPRPKFKDADPRDSDLWPAMEGLRNAKNFYVSTGNTPRHALRYAYGVKYYEGHGHARLRPRWRSDGRAERPYSGKVYVSLHPVSDYLADGPMDVVILNRNAKTKVYANIAYEREASFPGYIPADRIVAEHIARYPSFVGDYRPEFLRKYGLSKAEYDTFKRLIMNNAPHSDTNKKAKHSLGEWLVRYHEARLVEMARSLAAAAGMLLVYRDQNGFLARELPLKVTPTMTKVSRSRAKVPQSDSSGEDLPDSKNVLDDAPVKKKSKALARGKLARAAAKLTNELLINASRRAREFRGWINHRFHVHGTKPDGNCLFHAVSGYLRDVHQVVIDHATLRTNAVGFLRANRVRFNLTDKYLSDMETPAQPIESGVVADSLRTAKWGGDREILAMAETIHFNVNVNDNLVPTPITIRVYAPSHPNGFTRYDDDAQPRIPPRPLGVILYHVGGNHWEYLIPKHPDVLGENFA